MTNFDESRIKNKKLLYPELSYKIQGAVYAVVNKYGRGLKEIRLSRFNLHNSKDFVL